MLLVFGSIILDNPDVDQIKSGVHFLMAQVNQCEMY